MRHPARRERARAEHAQPALAVRRHRPESHVPRLRRRRDDAAHRPRRARGDRAGASGASTSTARTPISRSCRRCGSTTLPTRSGASRAGSACPAVIERPVTPSVSATLAHAWRARGGRSLVIQVGQAGSLQQEHCERLFRALIDLLEQLGLVVGLRLAEPENDVHFFGPRQTFPLIGEHAGWFVSRLEVGQWLQAGDLIGYVYDGFEGELRGRAARAGGRPPRRHPPPAAALRGRSRRATAEPQALPHAGGHVHRRTGPVAGLSAAARWRGRRGCGERGPRWGCRLCPAIRVPGRYLDLHWGRMASRGPHGASRRRHPHLGPRTVRSPRKNKSGRGAFQQRWRRRALYYAHQRNREV